MEDAQEEVHEEETPPPRGLALSLHAALSSLTADGDGIEEEEEEEEAWALETMRAVVRARPEAVWEWDERGFLPLHAAVMLMQPLSVLRCLVDAGPDAVRERTRGPGNIRMPPLHLAVAISSLEAVQFLVDVGPHDLLLEADGSGLLPLHRAARHNRPPLELIRCLVAACPTALQEPTRDVEQLLPLHLAAALEGGSPEVVEFLAEAYMPALRTRSGRGRLPLHHAAKGLPSLPIVQCLLRLYPQATRQRSGDDGRLPLHAAAANCYRSDQVVECLADASPQALGEKSTADGGALPLHLVAGSPFPSARIVALLAARHPPALLEVDEANGWLPLHRAAAANSASIVALQILVNVGPAALRKQDKRGRLPLHIVVAAASSSPPPLLLARVRCVTEAWPRGLAERDALGQLPLHAAAQGGAPVEVVQYLVRKLPRALQEPDAQGFLPIHCAAAANGDSSPDVVLFLAEAYPKGLRWRANDTRVPLRYAARNEATVQALHHRVEVLPIELRVPSLSAEGLLPSLRNALHDVLETVRFLPAEPRILHLPSSDGRLPLHVAADRAASLAVVRHLANADPTALRVRDGEGCLPIHWAALRSGMMDDAATRTAMANDIVTFLAGEWLQSLEEASDCGWLPLHYAVCRSTTSLEAVRFLAEAAPTALDTPSKTGQLPLHVAVSVPGAAASLDVIEYLAHECPRALDQPDATGFKPVHAAAAAMAGDGGPAPSLDVVYFLAKLFPHALNRASLNG